MRLTTTNKYPVDKPHLNTPTKPSTGPSILHSSFQHSNSPVLGRGGLFGTKRAIRWLSSRALEALEHCIGGREKRNLLRSPIDHSSGEGTIDDTKYHRGRGTFVDRVRGLEIGKIVAQFVFVFDHSAMDRMGSVRVFGCDTKERATGHFGQVYQTFYSDQGFMYVFGSDVGSEDTPRMIGRAGRGMRARGHLCFRNADRRSPLRPRRWT